MSAPGMITGLRADTFDNLQLNAGIMLKNFDYSNITSASALKTAIGTAITGNKCLGATRGGGSFNVTRERRTPDIDGMRYPFIGSEFVDSADAYLSTTLVEITADNLKLALGSGVATTSGNVTTIKMNTAYSDSDYLTNVCWVGDLADGRFVLICLKNALNTADLQLTYADKNEGTLTVEFHAHQEAVDDYDEAPFEVLVFATAT